MKILHNEVVAVKSYVISGLLSIWHKTQPSLFGNYTADEAHTKLFANEQLKNRK